MLHPTASFPGWRRGEEALDSLAYIDNFTEQEKAMVERLIIDEVRCPSCIAVSLRQTVLVLRQMYHELVMSVLQLKNSTKRPQEYLKEMAPMPNFRLEVCCHFLVTHPKQ